MIKHDDLLYSDPGGALTYPRLNYATGFVSVELLEHHQRTPYLSKPWGGCIQVAFWADDALCTVPIKASGEVLCQFYQAERCLMAIRMYRAFVIAQELVGDGNDLNDNIRRLESVVRSFATRPPLQSERPEISDEVMAVLNRPHGVRPSMTDVMKREPLRLPLFDGLEILFWDDENCCAIPVGADPELIYHFHTGEDAARALRYLRADARERRRGEAVESCAGADADSPIDHFIDPTAGDDDVA